MAFGEVMLRVHPPRRGPLPQRPRLEIRVVGAEANVTTALARLGHGIDVSVGGERMGLHFVNAGAGIRATEVIHGCAGDAFTEADPEER